MLICMFLNCHTDRYNSLTIKNQLDEELIFTFKNDGTGRESWAYDHQFHLILNMAIGGNLSGKKGVGDTLFPHIL